MLSGSDLRCSRPAGSVEADILFPPLCSLEWRTSVSKENSTEEVVSTQGGAMIDLMMYDTGIKKEMFS